MLIYDISYIIDSMPHISNKKLNQTDLDNLVLQLIKMITSLGEDRSSEVLFHEFFTDTEKIMFAKRLAIVFMLYEGISRPYISDTLLVSPSTVDRAFFNFENGKYKNFIRIFKRNNRTLWEVIENLITNSTLSYVGKRRLAWMDKLEEQYSTKVFKQ